MHVVKMNQTNNFKISKNVELQKRYQLLTVAFIVNAR